MQHTCNECEYQQFDNSSLIEFIGPVCPECGSDDVAREMR